MRITFDNCVTEFVRALSKAAINVGVGNGVIVRDMRGRLSFVATGRLEEAAVKHAESLISGDLKPYISPIGPLADSATPGAERVLKEGVFLTRVVRLNGVHEQLTVRVIDRRAVGIDWLHTPEAGDVSPPRLVFASLKGGVGRSTALSVLAADLADRGYSLLVLDLDLEAPGIGSMLIESAATPLFGTLDFFVEDSIRAVDESFLLDCVAASWLGGGRGRIDVVPSIGSMSLEHPQDVLSKLARAYAEGEDDQGNAITFLTRTQNLVSRLAALRRYDAILVDARAGLHETTAASVLGLGADVLLFGIDQPQTLSGYKMLLSQLSQLPVIDRENDWRYRLRMVQGKAETERDVLEYRNRAFDMFESVFYEQVSDVARDVLEDGFRFGIDDQNAPHFPIPIFEDERYRLFDPVQHRTQLTKGTYAKGFGSFLEFCEERLQLNEEAKS
jgi:cellulose biosynthesis protein BcsQ